VLTRFSTAFRKSGRVPDFFYFSQAIRFAQDRRRLLIGKATLPHRLLAEEPRQQAHAAANSWAGTRHH
jgi:hypothetical protein